MGDSGSVRPGLHSVAPAAQISSTTTACQGQQEPTQLCTCGRRGRLTGQGVYHVLSQAAPA